MEYIYTHTCAHVCIHTQGVIRLTLETETSRYVKMNHLL